MESPDDSSYGESDGESDSDPDYEYVGEARSFPLLVQLLYSGDWGAALDRIRTHPHEVRFNGWGSQTTSALHCAIHGAGDGDAASPPLEVVRSLIEAGDRHLILAQSSSGATALHLAVDRGLRSAIMNEVIRLMLQADVPEGRRVRGIPLDRRKPATKIETRDGDTLLGIFKETWEQCQIPDVESVRLRVSQEGGPSSPEELTGALRVLWNRADILLRATAGENIDTIGDNDRLQLHRILASPVSMPSSFVNLALRLCSEQAFERDRNGRVPLSAVAMSPGSQYGVSRDQWIYPIKRLIELCPSSASMADNDGRLPLHLAIDAGYRSWDTGIEAILLDAPRALATRDIKTRLYPFMMAAIDNKTDLTTVFLLLRQNPTMAWGLAEDPPWLKTAKLRDEVDKLRGENAELRSELELLRSQIYSMKVRDPEESREALDQDAEDTCRKRDETLGGHGSQKRKRSNLCAAPATEGIAFI